MTNVADVAARLAASKSEAEEGAAEMGDCMGREWARDHADYDKLRRLVAMEREGRLEVTDADDIAEVLGGVTAPDEIADFWQTMVGDRYPSTPFVRGFVEGALSFASNMALQWD